MTVKTQNPPTPATLRTICARYDIRPSAIARRLHVSRSAVVAALRADLNHRPISGRKRRQMHEIVLQLLEERKSHER